MFLKILLISLILISTQAYSSLFCEGGFSEDSILPETTTPIPNEIVISNQIIRRSHRYRTTKIRKSVQKWGESTLGRTLSADELHLLEAFYKENPSSEIKAKILRRRVRDFDQFNFSEKEIEILAQREIRLEFVETVKIKIPKNTQEEKALETQGFNASYRRGMDEINEWIAVREQLVRSKADPYLTHVDYFVKKMREYIVYVEGGVTTSSQARDLNRLKQHAEELIDKKQVTYYEWLKFNLSLSRVFDESSSTTLYDDGHFIINHTMIKKFPNHIGIPTVLGEMGIIAMNKGSAHGVYPLGLKRDKESLDFFTHDMFHFDPDRSSQLVYDKLVTHIKNLPLEKRKNIELAYFILTHEGDFAVEISDPKNVLSKIQEQIDLVLRPDNEELEGLIDVSHERSKKVQTLINDFLRVYHLVQREIEVEKEMEAEMEAESLWMTQELTGFPPSRE